MDRRALLVLGMHRSGTSALTRIIGHLGASLPLDPMPETADNPCGYWESRSIARFNNRLFESAGTRWNDDAALPDAWFADPARMADEEEAATLLATAFGDAKLFVLKDPRVCRLLPLWRNVLARGGIEPCAVVALRDPLEWPARFRPASGMRRSGRRPWPPSNAVCSFGCATSSTLRPGHATCRAP